MGARVVTEVTGFGTVSEREMDQQKISHTFQCHHGLEFILYLIQSAVFFCTLFANIPLFLGSTPALRQILF